MPYGFPLRNNNEKEKKKLRRPNFGICDAKLSGCGQLNPAQLNEVAYNCVHFHPVQRVISSQVYVCIHRAGGSHQFNLHGAMAYEPKSPAKCHSWRDIVPSQGLRFKAPLTLPSFFDDPSRRKALDEGRNSIDSTRLGAAGLRALSLASSSSPLAATRPHDAISFSLNGRAPGTTADRRPEVPEACFRDRAGTSLSVYARYYCTLTKSTKRQRLVLGALFSGAAAVLER